VILTPDAIIDEEQVRALLPVESVGAKVGRFRPETPLREMLDEVERDLIEQALDHRGGHVTKTAADLGLERSHLYKKMRALGIRKPGSE
jgi:DNA-binding NtrC family response regulator